MSRSGIRIATWLSLATTFMRLTAVGDENRTSAKQSFRIHIPSGIRIMVYDSDPTDSTQTLSISTGTDVIVAKGNSSVHFGRDVDSQTNTRSFFVQIPEGQSVFLRLTTINSPRTEDMIPTITILPGW